MQINIEIDLGNKPENYLTEFIQKMAAKISKIEKAYSCSCTLSVKTKA